MGGLLAFREEDSEQIPERKVFGKEAMVIFIKFMGKILLLTWLGCECEELWLNDEGYKGSVLDFECASFGDFALSPGGLGEDIFAVVAGDD